MCLMCRKELRKCPELCHSADKVQALIVDDEVQEKKSDTANQRLKLAELAMLAGLCSCRLFVLLQVAGLRDE